MIWLVIGIAVWCAVHFIPSLARGFRARMIERFGEKQYKLAFALAILASVALMVVGWRTAAFWDVYNPPEWGRPIASALILIAFLLFALAHSPTNVKRVLRHPQLTGLIVWAIGHLLANGDILSVVLFGGLGVWAVAEIVLINRREGAWVKPEPVPISAEIRPVLIGVLVFVAFFAAHPYLFGVSPMGDGG